MESLEIEGTTYIILFYRTFCMVGGGGGGGGDTIGKKKKEKFLKIK